jgi:biotin carboxylase
MTNSNRSVRREELPRRVLLLLTSRSYRSTAFVNAADRLGIEVVKAIDMQEHLADYWNYPLGLEYNNIDKATAAIKAYSVDHPLGAILPVDDSGTLLAALANESLGLPHNSPKAATAARDKYRMRQLLEKSPINSPSFKLHTVSGALDEMSFIDISQSTSYPCVVKPISLSGSRGVIRANSQDEFVSAAKRLVRLLSYLNPGGDSKSFLVEDYIPGFEVALEGILDDGQLTVLALFDKPDPLDGPYFEETIYVTPSRLSPEIQESITSCVVSAAETLGLREGSVHAELRVNDEGPWLIEMAGRSIGGLCSHTLRFAAENTLEELILRQAFGMEFVSLKREHEASGVMMLPIPGAGLLKKVDGCEEAEAVPLVEQIEITARLNYSLKPLPEGDSYLGFIFARGETPESVENALRAAHKKLKFEIATELPLLSSSV